MENIEVPAHWSQVAVDVLAQKYFRKTGIPCETVAARGATMHKVLRLTAAILETGDSIHTHPKFCKADPPGRTQMDAVPMLNRLGPEPKNKILEQSI
jgi:Class II vitamin B12-dependent ribonucleotide reductase